MSAEYEVVIERTGVAIMTTNDKHHAIAAAIFRQAIFGPLVMREVVKPYRRNTWVAPPMGTANLQVSA